MLDCVWRRTIENDGCANFILVDLNCAHTDGHRVDLRLIELVPSPDTIARHFKRRMEGFLKVEQVGYTRRQLSDGIPILLSRIDQSYARNPLSDLDGVSIRRHCRSVGLQVMLSVGVCGRTGSRMFRMPLSQARYRSNALFGRVKAIKVVFRCVVVEAAARIAKSKAYVARASHG